MFNRMGAAERSARGGTKVQIRVSGNDGRFSVQQSCFIGKGVTIIP